MLVPHKPDVVDLTEDQEGFFFWYVNNIKKKKNQSGLSLKTAEKQQDAN